MRLAPSAMASSSSGAAMKSNDPEPSVVGGALPTAQAPAAGSQRHSRVDAPLNRSNEVRTRHTGRPIAPASLSTAAGSGGARQADPAAADSIPPDAPNRDSIPASSSETRSRLLQFPSSVVAEP